MDEVASGGVLLGQSAAGAQRLARLIAILLALVLAGPASAHPLPFSYIDLRLTDTGIDGRLTVHVNDAAHELKLVDPLSLLDPARLGDHVASLENQLGPRLGLGQLGPIRWTGQRAIAGQDALTLRFHIARTPQGSLVLDPRLFPYDRSHETFVNIYEHGRLRQQFVFSSGSPTQTYYRGTTAGAVAVMRNFIPLGVHHIWIGADHLLFLFGLILMGGGWRRLTLIVTAFTVGHSITLSLAALDVVALPASLVEPAIALSIVAVGADNLSRGRRGTPDLRAPAAAVFGLVHGFGFASVLKETGLSPSALGWSLFSFNVGVELGQLAMVVAAGALLVALRRRSDAILHSIETGGSAMVLAGGAYWFVERSFF